MMRHLWPYLSKYRFKLISGFIFILISNAISVINPKIIQRAIDYLEKNIVAEQLLYYGMMVIGVSLIFGFFRFLTRRTIIVVSRLIENDLRNDLFLQLQKQSDSYYQKNSTGDIMAKLTNDLNAVRSVLGPGLMYTFNTITMFIFVISMMIQISPKLTVLALIPAPFMAWVVNRIGKQINKRFHAVQEQFSVISTKAQENLSGIRIIKSYVREKSESQNFDYLNKEYIRKNMDYVKIFAAFRPIMMLIVGIGVAIILLFGGRMINHGIISLGEYVAFDLYLSMLVWPSIALGWVMNIFYQGAASMNRLETILLAQSEVQDVDQPKIPKNILGRIELKNLSFAYPGTETIVLNNLNLEIKSGQITAVLGRTGSGKSTLIRLITRIYNSPENTLIIDGTDILRLPLRFLRDQLGYIPQESFLFSDTIRENIRFGKVTANQEEIENAARLAEIHDAIMDFPNGYDTMLGERGINLSGGQKQRLAMARAIIREPKILILDDALSAVDTLTEESILNNLGSVMINKTCLWISHRIQAIKNADQIIVMDKGEIIERGTHGELLLINGLYADMYEKQQLEEFIEQVE